MTERSLFGNPMEQGSLPLARGCDADARVGLAINWMHELENLATSVLADVERAKHAAHQTRGEFHAVEALRAIETARAALRACTSHLEAAKNS